MSKIISNEKLKSTGIITVCLVLLFNPYIKVLDIMPDFIAYFIAAKLLSDIAFKAPYFEEMRTALKRLGILSIVRLCALLPLAYLQTKTETVNDTVTLLAFVFSVIEMVLAISAVSNFVKAVGYLSERTSATTLYGPFKIRGEKRMSMDELSVLTYIFAAVKCAGNFIPEMCLLSRTGIEGGFSPARLYPYLFIFFFVLTWIVGAIWLSRALKYLKHLKTERTGIFAAVEELVTEDRLLYIENKKTIKKKKHALVCMMIAAFLNFDITLTEFREINLLPCFISAIVMIVGFFILTKNTGKYLVQRIVSGVYIAASVLKTAALVKFLIVYSYSDLIKSEAAKAEYKGIIALAIVEFLALLFFMISLAISMSKYTDIEFCSEHSDMTDRNYRRSFRRKAAVFSAIGIAVGALKLMNTIVNSTVNSEFVGTPDATVGTVYYSDMPWLPLVISVFVIIYGFYAIHYFGAIKDDEEMKYAERSHV